MAPRVVRKDLAVYLKRLLVLQVATSKLLVASEKDVLIKIQERFKKNYFVDAIQNQV